MPKQGNESQPLGSGLAGRIGKVTAIVVSLTALVTAILHFRDSIPWLTPVATIEVTPNPANLDIGDKFQIVATVKDSKGNLLGKRVSWSSANPNVAGVDNDGITTANAVGETTITGSIGLIKGVMLVHVRRVNVASIEVFPPATTLQVGDHLKFDATPYDSDGNSLLDRLVRWASENDSVASVEQTSGSVTGKSVGSVNVTAESEGKLNAALVTVRPNVNVAAEVAGGGSLAQPPLPPAGSSAPLHSAESAAVKAKKGIGHNDHAPTYPAAHEEPLSAAPAPQALSLAMAPKISIHGGVKTGECPASVRVLFANTLVELKSDPQEVLGVPVGNLTYNLHGTVSCAGQSIAAVDGHGTVSIVNQKSYRCHWRRTGPKDYVISLEPE